MRDVVLLFVIFIFLMLAVGIGSVVKDIVLEATRKCTFDAIDRER